MVLAPQWFTRQAFDHYREAAEKHGYEPSPKQLAAIADMMAWAIRSNGLSLDRIGGHYHYANTGCPGQHLRKYLEDGTLRRMVAERLDRR